MYTETDSRKVRRLLAKHKPDLGLLDLQMPHVDGFTVLAQIRKYAAGGYLPVMVLTPDTTTVARIAFPSTDSNRRRSWMMTSVTQYPVGHPGSGLS